MAKKMNFLRSPYGASIDLADELHPVLKSRLTARCVMPGEALYGLPQARDFELPTAGDPLKHRVILVGS